MKLEHPSQKGRIDSLTGLRTLAAAWVVIFHFKDEILKFFPNVPGVVFHFIKTGWLGVDVFFILSGFVISYNYSESFRTFDGPTYKRYLWLRLARIYPLHLIVLIAYGVLLLAASLGFGKINNPEDFTLQSLITYLLLIQAWGFGIQGWNQPAWSITAEWFAYLTFPIIRAITAKLNTNGWLLCSLIALTLVPVMASTASGAGVHFVNLTRIVTEFSTGGCLFWLYQTRFGKHWNWRLITPASLLLVPATAIVCSSLKIVPFWTVLPIGIMVYALTQTETNQTKSGKTQGLITAWLSSKSMIFWGQVSYAVYLTHLLTRSLLTRVLKPDSYVDANTFIKLGVLLAFAIGIAVVAIVAYLWVEEPARKWMRRIYDQANPQSNRIKR